MKHELLEIPQPGKEALPLSARWMGRIARMFNALLRMEIKRGSGDSVTWSDGKLILTLKRIEASTGGSGSLTVREADSSPNVSNVDTIVVPNGSLTDDGSGQITIDISSGTSIYQAEIQSWTEGNDYASVRFATYNETTNVWDDDAVTGSFNAALPHLHRADEEPSSSHGDAVAHIYPAYTAGDIVLIAQPEGGTGVEVSSADLEWMILPNKRSWCFEVTVCVGTTTYYMIIPAWSCSTSSDAAFNPVD